MTSTTRYVAPGFGATAVLAALHSPLARGLRRNLTELRYQAWRSGRHVALPVSYARSDDSVVVRVAHAHTKTWWRNFRVPRPVSVWIDGRWCNGTGHVAQPGSLEHEEVAAVYQEAYPRTVIPATDPFVVIEFAGAHGVSSNSGPASRLWWPWFGNVTLGELLGFAVPAVTGALLWDAAPAVLALALLLAGAVEGSVLGAFQARVLRRVLPGLRAGDWIRATIAGALLAWAIGAVPVLAGNSLSEWPIGAQVGLGVIGGAVLLLCLGVAQWFVLRRYLPRASRWIWATALAWLAGLAVFTAFTSPLWQPGQSSALVFLIGVVGGLLMAAAMAAVTGAFLIRILRPRL